MKFVFGAARSEKIKLTAFSDGVTSGESRPQQEFQRLLAHTSEPISKRKILVVDDDQVMLKAISLKLSAAGFEVLTVADGSEAITAMRDFNPHLLILDINFPPDIFHASGIEWDGFKLMSWLRLLEAKAVPVIVITAGEADDYRQPALAAGAFAFFQKPFPPSALLAAVEKALENQQGNQPEQPRFDPGL